MKKLIFILLTFLGFNSCMNAQEQNYSDMDVAEFSKYVTKDGVQLIDVRTPEEYEEGHIAGARNINVFDSDFIDEALSSLDKSRPIAVYCRSGKRSADAARQLSKQGYTVTNLKGGILDWNEHHLPITKIE
ncbi:MAG: rhodanese-like domain-containing protein [Bacteroides sp.]|nr:rhodanese-like domain-containing protein [Bacteroides sp.]